MSVNKTADNIVKNTYSPFKIEILLFIESPLKIKNLRIKNIQIACNHGIMKTISKIITFLIVTTTNQGCINTRKSNLSEVKNLAPQSSITTISGRN